MQHDPANLAWSCFFSYLTFLVPQKVFLSSAVKPTTDIWQMLHSGNWWHLQRARSPMNHCLKVTSYIVCQRERGAIQGETEKGGTGGGWVEKSDGRWKVQAGGHMQRTYCKRHWGKKKKDRWDKIKLKRRQTYIPLNTQPWSTIQFILHVILSLPLPAQWRAVHSDPAGGNAAWHSSRNEVPVWHELCPSRLGSKEHPGQ